MRLSSTDVRIAIRTLARQPLFATVAVLSLALAIALNTTMYSVLDSLINPRLDFRDPDQLYSVQYYGDMRRRVSQAVKDSTLLTATHTYQGFARQQMMDQVTARYGPRFHEASVKLVDTAYYHLLGVHPIAGRVFGASDLRSQQPLAVISEGLANELFPGGNALGKTFIADIGAGGAGTQSTAYTVIGVIEDASQLRYADISTLPTASSLPNIPVTLLRLKPDISQARLESELAVLSSRLALLAGESPRDNRFYVQRAISHQFSYRGFDVALTAAVLAVLLVACSNLANLQLARGISRGRELAVRVAVGARRQDLITHLFLEATVLSCAGLVAGLLLTLWAVFALHGSLPPRMGDYLTEPRVSWRVLAFALVVAVFCALAVGLLPALRVSRVDPNELLKSGAGTGATKLHRRYYGVLVAVQIGLALALLAAASVVVRFAWRWDDVRVNYDIDQLASASGALPVRKGSVLHYDTYLADLLTHVRGQPDVADASAGVNQRIANDTVTAEDESGTPHRVPAPMYGYTAVTPSYIRTMGLPMIAGRDFLEGERDIPVAIVDEHTARFLWGDPAHALGKMIKLGSSASTRPWIHVVGVVSNMTDRTAIVTAQPGQSRLGMILVNLTAADSIVNKYDVAFVGLEAKARTKPEELPITLRHFFRTLGARYVSSARAGESLRVGRQRNHFVAIIFGLFAAVGVALAALGIYGTAAHAVAERRREIGVRIAMGASARDIFGSVLREGNAVALTGVALGLLLTKYSVGLLWSFSFEDDKYDAPLFAAVAVVLFLTALAAAFFPASRATRIDPVESLRSE